MSQYHIFHNKTRRNVPGIEPGPPRGEAGYKPPEPLHSLSFFVMKVLFYPVFFLFPKVYLFLEGYAKPSKPKF